MSESLVKRLREKPSKYNRDLLDEAADTIERLEKSAKTEAKPIEKSEAEIMKALECCIDEDNELTACEGCVFMECKMGKERECMYYMLKSVLDLINRKNAKIEKLNFENLQMVASIKGLRAEAIKEFAERVKTEFEDSKYKVNDTFYARTCNTVVDSCIEVIDQIAKEMGVEL